MYRRLPHFKRSCAFNNLPHLVHPHSSRPYLATLQEVGPDYHPNSTMYLPSSKNRNVDRPSYPIEVEIQPQPHEYVYNTGLADSSRGARDGFRWVPLPHRPRY